MLPVLATIKQLLLTGQTRKYIYTNASKDRIPMRTANDIMYLGQLLAEKYKLLPGNENTIPVKIDDGGVGGGVVDRLKEVRKEEPERFWWLDVYPMKFGQKISKHKFYDDTTTYMMFNLKKQLMRIDENGNKKPVEIILPNDDHLIGQLSCRKYGMTPNGKLRVESKEAMKKELDIARRSRQCVIVLFPGKKKKKGTKQ